MSVSFKVLNAELQFHNDLKKYYELSCEFQAVHDKVYKTVRHSFDVNAEPADIFQIIEAAAKQFVSELINRLSNYGVFDRAASDYLNTNNGYLQLLNATTAYYKYTKNTAQRNNAIAEASKESANALINRSISGLDFSIISSSIIDHAVYAAMNHAEIRKQSTEAVTQGALEAAQKDRSKWLILTVIFGMISAFVLIVSFLAPKAFWLFLFCAGVTAITGYMLNDSAKTIAKCQSTNSNRSEKEQEIFKLKSTIISSANIEDLL